MYCPYCEGNLLMEVKKYDYHQTDRLSLQPYNTFLTVLYSCPECGTTVESSQQVRITNVKEK